MQEAACHFMSEKEVQNHIEWLREGDQIDDLLREAVHHNRFVRILRK
jgi:hypothetical protein